jgi:hypothetical protein
MKNNDFTPDEVRYRKALDHLRDRMDTLSDERHLAALVEQANRLVHKINTMGTNALKAPVVLWDLDTERAKFRAHHEAAHRDLAHSPGASA